MDDNHSGLALQYGNPGPALYSSSAQAWHFSRRLRSSHQISYVGLTNIVVPPSPSDSPTEEKEAQQEERSRFISEATSNFDPQISSLFEFGHARLSKSIRWTSRLRTMPIVALASGKDRNILSFRAVEDEPIDMRHLTGSHFRVPTISDSVMVNWYCNEPIKQIRFANSVEEPEGLFAVRLQSRTCVFRLTYSQEHVVIYPSLNDDHAQSKTQVTHIDPYCVAEVDISQTSGHAHVDVTFNPWYQKQFAIMDERGNWSIWLLSDIVPNSAGNSIDCCYSGSLFNRGVNHNEDQHDSHDEDENEDHILNDGWGKIEWVGNTSTFIACNRCTAMLYVTEDTLVSCKIELNLQPSTERILDVKTCLRKCSYIFVLTTLRILFFDISSHELDLPSIQPLFARQHGRDPSDHTLRLTSLSVGPEYYLLLYSRLDACILAFEIPVDDSDDLRPSMSDPFFISVHGNADTNGLNTIRYETPIRQVLFKEVEQGPLKARVRFTQRERLMKLFVLDSSLAVHQHIFSGADKPPSEEEVPTNREMLCFGKALDLFRKKEEQDTIFIESFIPANREANPGEEQQNQHEPQKHRNSVNFNRVYALFAAGDTRYTKKSSGGSIQYQSFREYIDHMLAKLLIPVEDGHEYMQTMSEIINSLPASSDIVESFQEFERFKSKFSPANTSAERTLLFLPLKVLAKTSRGETETIRSFQSSDLLDLYNKLVGEWLSPLDQSIPSWTRISKEKLIRQVSIDLTLASMIETDAPPSDGDILPSSHILSSQRTDLSEDLTRTSHDVLDLKAVSPQSMGIPEAGAAEEVLSQWTIGGDPDSFEWDRVFTNIDASENDTRSRSRTRTRTRSRSRAPSEGLRALRSSPIVPIVQHSGSQPQQSFSLSSRIPLQSSQLSEDMLPMTQTERGLFGSREAGKKSNVKARKKKRAAGF